MVAHAGSPTSAESTAWAALRAVMDPEIPMLSVVDLGVVRHVNFDASGHIEVGLTPTYSGCPATAIIRSSVIAALQAAGFTRPTVVEVLQPPWSSEWLSSEGRQTLRRFGIAPPSQPVVSPRELLGDTPDVRCPSCESGETEELSRFGSTPCKALYRCKSCREPFEYFKCI